MKHCAIIATLMHRLMNLACTYCSSNHYTVLRRLVHLAFRPRLVDIRCSASKLPSVATTLAAALRAAKQQSGLAPQPSSSTCLPACNTSNCRAYMMVELACAGLVTSATLGHASRHKVEPCICRPVCRHSQERCIQCCEASVNQTANAPDKASAAMLGQRAVMCK